VNTLTPAVHATATAACSGICNAMNRVIWLATLVISLSACSDKHVPQSDCAKPHATVTCE
jgi:hypothetical protein